MLSNTADYNQDKTRETKRWTIVNARGNFALQEQDIERHGSTTPTEQTLTKKATQSRTKTPKTEKGLARGAYHKKTKSVQRAKAFWVY